MSDKLYSEPYEMVPLQYTKPSHESLSHCQQMYPYSTLSVNSYSQSMDVYGSNMGPHSFLRQSNTYMNMEQPLDVNWDNRLINDIEKNVKIPDKIDLIELTSKDLSPASYCSNLDLLLPDYYKSSNKDVCKYDNHWINANYSNQKSFEYPSCAQVARNGHNVEKTVRYCSIQKDVDGSAVQSGAVFSESSSLNKNCMLKGNEVSLQYCSYPYYQNKEDGQAVFETVVDQLYNPNQPVAEVPFRSLNIEQLSEGSNEESDIIVEESDDDITDISEEPERRSYCQSNKCVICNLLYTPVGTQFYFLTAESPLTMSSQKPVFTKILEMVGPALSKQNYLCNQCLGLINTIDHLQLKLQNFCDELQSKFKKTCLDNNISCGDLLIAKSKNNSKQTKVKKFTEYKCKTCKTILSLRKICEKHLQRHKKRFLCEHCGKTFMTSKQFNSHMYRHKVKKKVIKIDPFKCSNCPKYFRTKSNLKEHENFCLGILPFTCKAPDCDKKFASSSKLKNHVKLKHDKKFIAICSICNIGFVNVDRYKSHKVSHSADKKFSCDKCDKSYKTLSNLNFHMKVHQAKLPFICEICSKGFMRKEYLEAHVNNHKGVKNFSCPVCEKKFVSQKNLDAHLKYHDGTIKKKTCNVCRKEISTGYEEHLRTHSNLFEYECNLCDKRFNTKGALSKHKKIKHNSLQKSFTEKVYDPG